MTTLGDLFKVEPEQWGLRGDPWVCAAMRDRLSNEPLPTDLDDVRQRLLDTFREVVGVDLTDRQVTEEHVYREEFAHGGMSSGGISLPTWRERLVPLLVDTASRHLRTDA